MAPPKRRRGSSSRSRADDEDEIIEPPQDRHPFLAFHTQGAEARYQSFLDREFLDVVYIDWNVLATLQIADDIRGFLPRPWRRLLITSCPQFLEPTIEFYVTYHYDREVSSMDFPAVSFRLGGQQHRLSIREFATALGIYLDDELDLLGVWEDTDDVRLFEFWLTIASSQFNTSSTKATTLLDPRHHMLHRLLTTTIWNRRESMNNVNLSDLRVLFPLITGRPFCPAVALAQAFPRLMGAKSNSPIAGGQFVTLLGRGLGAWTEEDEEGDMFTQVGDIRPLSLDTLKTMLLVKQVGRDWVLVHGPARRPWVHPGQPQPQPQPEEQQEIPHHQGGGAEHFQHEHHIPGGYVPPPHYQYAPPPGYQFSGPDTYDPYTAYVNMMAAFENIGAGFQHMDGRMDHLTTRIDTIHTDQQRERRDRQAYQRQMDGRFSSLYESVGSLRGSLDSIQQDLTSHFGAGPSAMQQDDDDDDDGDDEEADDGDDD